MSKTVSARISNNTHDKLLEKCNKSGCTINDYLNKFIEKIVNDDFDTKSNTQKTTDDKTGNIQNEDGSWTSPDGVRITKIGKIE